MRIKQLFLSLFLTITVSSCSLFKSPTFDEEQDFELANLDVYEDSGPDPIPGTNPVPDAEPAQVYYYITFRNYDNSFLTTVPTPAGEMPVYDGKEPFRSPTDYEKYNFAGWEPALTAADSDRTYFAKFTTVDVTFNVSFYMDDKKTLLYSNDFKYGQMPTIPPDPTKPGNASTVYTFKCWDKQVVPVTSDAKYNAVFTTSKKQYRVTFYDDDEETVLQTGLWDYGSTPQFTQGNPAKQATNSTIYSFKGWNKNITKVTGEQTYIAVYENKTKLYNIRFEDEDGTLLQNGTCEYGEIPSCPTPTKESTENEVYEFVGWEPSIKSVTKDETYVAKYSTKKRNYRVTFYNYDFSELGYKDCEYGEYLVPPNPTRQSNYATGIQTTYTFVGWSNNKDNMSVSNATLTLPQVTATASYYAVFTANKEYDYSLTYSSYKGMKKRSITLLDSTYSAIKNDITWTSNNTSVAKVDSSGKVTAVGVGTATITAQTPDGKKATCAYETIDAKLVIHNDRKPQLSVQRYNSAKWSYFFGISNNDKLTHPIPYTEDYYTVTWTTSGKGSFYNMKANGEMYAYAEGGGNSGSTGIGTATLKFDTEQSVKFMMAVN